MSNWTKIATAADVPDATGLELTVGDRIIALFRVEDDYHAIDGICAHAGGPVAEGALNGCIVTCPWHGWQYDVTTGHHCLNSHIQQQSFPVKVEDGDIFVELP